MPDPVPQAGLGAIGWADLMVDDATGVRDFDAAVVGWAPTSLDMGGYDDYLMQAPGAAGPQARICHARAANAGLPPAWLLYVTVADLLASLAACKAGGGSVVAGPRGVGGGATLAIIRDPAGAVLALYQAAPRGA